MHDAGYTNLALTAVSKYCIKTFNNTVGYLFRGLQILLIL